MIKQLKINKTSWLLNPWFDTIVLSGLPMGLLLIPTMLYAAFQVESLRSWIYAISNFPHVLAGFIIFFLLSGVKRRTFILYVLATVALFSAVLILCLNGHKDLMESTRFQWGRIHIFLQLYFILLAFKLVNGDNLFLDKVIDTTTIFIGALLHAFPQLFSFYSRRFPGGIKIFSNFRLDIDMQATFMAILWFCLLIFTLRQVYLFIRLKKFYPFKILLILSVFAVNYWPLIIAQYRRVWVTHEIPTVLHSLQYIFWVWFYLRCESQSRTFSGPKLVHRLAKGLRGSLYFLFLLGISSVYVSIMLNKPMRVYFPAVGIATAHIHFFTDMLIWNSSRIYAMTQGLKGHLSKEATVS